MPFFLSYSGELLPRWTLAFPDATAIPLEAGAAVIHSTGTVWLRLRIDAPLLPQLLDVQRQTGRRPDIVLSDAPNDDEGLAMLSAGIRGYCNSHATPELLQQVAAVVAQGGLWVGESLMQRLVNLSEKVVVPPSVQPDLTTVLTQREIEVALIVANGASNKEIARQLGIAERTVKAHVGAVFEKLDVRDRLQLAMLIHGLRPA